MGSPATGQLIRHAPTNPPLHNPLGLSNTSVSEQLFSRTGCNLTCWLGLGFLPWPGGITGDIECPWHVQTGIRLDQHHNGEGQSFCLVGQAQPGCLKIGLPGYGAKVARGAVHGQGA